ncbi:MAG: hypothetical protein HY367_04425 [Candidatus Aenigmarchaeota archaeon]|nr:hypothetical protein [Candidatus Aenigmarchaeota archaeon]
MMATEITNGEQYGARIAGETLYYSVKPPAVPEEHYDARNNRLEVFILYPSTGKGGDKVVEKSARLPFACGEVRFTEGSVALFAKLKGELIDQFLDASF